jgi:long-subunit fatty acid transport protein
MSVGSVDVDTDLTADDQTIKNIYKWGLNLRAGIEGRFDMLRVRGGVAYYQSPFRNLNDGIDRNILAYTGGFGVFFKHVSLDLGLTYTSSRSVYTPYSLPNPDFYYSAVSKNQQITGALTVSFLF